MLALDPPNGFGAGWLRDRDAEQVGGEGGPLNIMYRVDGGRTLTRSRWSIGRTAGARDRPGSATVRATGCSLMPTARR